MNHPLRLPRLTRDRAASVLLALAPLVYFFPVMRGQLVLCPGDGRLQNLPYRVLWASTLRDGHLPLWNPFIFGGMPLLATMQGGVLLPLNWFFLLFPAAVAMNLSVLSSYALAGVGAYLYMRRRWADIPGAIVTGLVWQWSGFQVAQIGHINIVQTAALLPWLLWAIDGYGETARRRRAVLIALLVALQAFAGHPQTFAYSLLLATVYAACQALKAPQHRRAYLLSLVMVAAGLALAAVQILPTVELLRHSIRMTADYQFFSSFSLPREFLKTFLAPYVWGGGHGSLFRAPYVGPQFYGEYAGYVGLLTLTLAVMAVIIKRNAQTKFWSAVALVCLALAFGRYLPFDLYRLVYYVPLLNLFRVPSRHLMEVDFALAVLAGHAVSDIPRVRRELRTTLITLALGVCVLAFTFLSVTRWRPAAFRLGREGPVSLLRAPELFLPVLLAALSMWVLWRFVRGRRGATLFLVAFIALDLGLWGQAGEWRASPSPADALFREPPVAAFLKQSGKTDGRILTLAQPFNPDSDSAGPQFDSGEVGLSTQPDIYMMHGIVNAAGYDGFGLARYSRLAGDMKVWGELVSPERSLNEGREFDLLNVRYLVSMRERAVDLPPPLEAGRVVGAYAFSERGLNVSPLKAHARLTFIAPQVSADKVALITTLGWSAAAAQGEEVARLRVWTDDGRTFEFSLRAGVDSAEWSIDRPQQVQIRHGRAPVAESWNIEAEGQSYEGHSYLTAFALPERTTITGGEIEVMAPAQAPQLNLSVLALSLVDESRGVTVALRKEWLNKRPQTAPSVPQVGSERWRPLAQFDDASLYENTRALPRAWLSTEAVTQPDEISLEVIHTGKLPDGRAWDARRTAMVEGATPLNPTGTVTETEASIIRYEPNRIDVRTACDAPSILVLSENHYPGWRATVDGREQEVLRVDYNLRGVALTPGEHTVSFLYRPRSVLSGSLLSLSTALVLLFWCLRGARRAESSREAREVI